MFDIEHALKSNSETFTKQSKHTTKKTEKNNPMKKERKSFFVKYKTQVFKTIDAILRQITPFLLQFCFLSVFLIHHVFAMASGGLNDNNLARLMDSVLAGEHIYKRH